MFSLLLQVPVQHSDYLLAVAMRKAQSTQNREQRAVTLDMIQKLVECGASTKDLNRNEYAEDIRDAAGMNSKYLSSCGLSGETELWDFIATHKSGSSLPGKIAT
ncbi:MAG: hypothetical protein R3C18_02875 [Planctomycetaceae bacterium]